VLQHAASRGISRGGAAKPIPSKVAKSGFNATNNCVSALPVQVRLTAAVPTVTQAQRMLFLQAAVACMSAQGITYRFQPGENRIWFYQGSRQGYVCLPCTTSDSQATCAVRNAGCESVQCADVHSSSALF
jgi:hypothetical protein